MYTFALISYGIADVGNLIYYYKCIRSTGMKSFLYLYWVKSLNESSKVMIIR